MYALTQDNQFVIEIFLEINNHYKSMKIHENKFVLLLLKTVIYFFWLS